MHNIEILDRLANSDIDLYKITRCVIIIMIHVTKGDLEELLVIMTQLYKAEIVFLIVVKS